MAPGIAAVALTDLPEVLALIRRVVAQMAVEKVFQWDDIYPDAATVQSDAVAGTLFGFYEADRLQGLVVLNREEPPEYAPLPWEYANPLVVHRLAVDPPSRHRGIARKLMAFAEDLALQLGLDSIRLDTFTGNPAALQLYRGLGYAWRGQVQFRKGDFDCFEKAISP